MSIILNIICETDGCINKISTKKGKAIKFTPKIIRWNTINLIYSLNKLPQDLNT